MGLGSPVCGLLHVLLKPFNTPYIHAANPRPSAAGAARSRPGCPGGEHPCVHRLLQVWRATARWHRRRHGACGRSQEWEFVRMAITFKFNLALPAWHSNIPSIAHSRTFIHLLRWSGHALLRAGQHPEDIHVPPRPQAPGALGITFLQNSFVWECQSRCPSAARTASALEPSACAHCRCSWHGPTCSEIST